MPISPDALIADRYKLLECLGAGGMGEVWKAQDTNFSRLIVVAVKLLKEDETLAEDVRQRSNFERYLKREAALGPLTLDLLVGALDEAFNIGFNLASLKQQAEAWFGKKPITPDNALLFFDELVGDSTYNENARHRRRLRDLFATEANSVAVLQHPNIVRVTDYGEQNGMPFLVMDFISGRTLQQVIQRRETMPLTRRLRLMEDLCEGLAYAHSKDLVHRDIKPANLIIDGETHRLKILDFGVARTMQFSSQRSVSRGAPIGTYSYMSPEQTRAARTLDNRSDIFAVGLVCYEFLTLQRAFPSSGDLSELIARIQRDPPPPLRDLVPDIDPEVERIVYRAIEKVPAKRYQDLTDMQRELEVVRARLEEEEKRQTGTVAGRSKLVKPKPLLQRITDLIDRAQNAFDSEDDQAVVGLCDEALRLMPQQPDAIELKERSLARMAVRMAETLIDDGRKLLDAGDLSAAEALLRRTELDLKLPTVSRFARDVEAHRQERRVTNLVAEARAHLAVAAFPDAIGKANNALEIDASNADAQQVLADARSALQQQRQQRIAATLEEADWAAAEQRLDDALRILRPISDESAAKSRIAVLERLRDEQAARQAALARALASAGDLMGRGEFAAAETALREARSIDATSPDVLELDASLTPIVRAIERLNKAIALFDRDEPAEADEQLESARTAFGSITSRVQAVEQLLESAERASVAQKMRARVRESRVSLEAGRLEEALDHARAALHLGPDTDEARNAVQHVQAAMHARRQQQIAAAMTAAHARAAEQEFDEALRILAPVADDPAVASRIEMIVRERDAAHARREALAQSLERTTRCIDGEDFAGALDALSGARALDETNPRVAELDAWLSPLVSALAHVEHAILSYQADDLQAGDHTVQSATTTLAPYAVEYASVRERLAAADAARREALAREDARRQREAEIEEERRRQAAREEQERIARAVEKASVRVRAAMAKERFDEANQALAALAALPGSESTAAELAAALTAARQRVATREATRKRDDARKLVIRGRLDDALAILEAYSPAHPVVTAEIDLMRAAIQVRDEARAREAEAARALEEAERARAAAERLREEEAARAREEAERARQVAERARAEEAARAQRELDERADQAIAAADAIFSSGARAEAIEQLAAFAPQHVDVDRWLAAFRREHERLEAAARAEEAERARRALEEQADQTIAAADRLFADGQRLEAIDQLTVNAPQHAKVQQHLAALQREHGRLEAAAQAEAAERARRAAEERADHAIAAADALFSGGKHLEAIALLTDLTPQHARVQQHLVVLRREHERREAAARAEAAERARRAAEERADHAIAAADALFSGGKHLEAIALLTDLTPQHPRVQQRLAALRHEHERLEAAARAEAAERARRAAEERIDHAIAAADALFAHGRRLEAIEQLTAIAPPHAKVQQRLAVLRREHERLEAAARAEEAERAQRAADEQADHAIAAANVLFADGQRLDAIEQLAAIVPQHAKLEQHLAVLRREHDRLEAAARSEEAERARRAADERADQAIAAADVLFADGQRLEAIEQLTAIAPQHAKLEQHLAVLRREHDRLEAAARSEEAERVRRAADEQADHAIAAAEALFADGQRLEAIEQLTAIAPQHAKIEQRLATLRREHDRLEAEARAEAERLQREAERARLDAERQELVTRAREARANRNYAAALESVAAALRVTPADREAAQLRRELLSDVRAAQRQDASNPALQSLLVQYDPGASRRRVIARAAMVAAMITVVTGISAFLLLREPTPPTEGATSQPTTVTPTPATGSGTNVVNVPTPPVTSPPPPPADMGLLTVNLRPWARVRITSRDAAATVPAEPQLTPFTLPLLPGEYTLLAENGDLTPPTEVSVKVESGKATVISRDMPGFSPDRTVDALLGTNR